MSLLVLGIGGAGIDIGRHLSTMLSSEFLALNSGSGRGEKNARGRQLLVPPPIRIYDESDLFRWGDHNVLAIRDNLLELLTGCSRVIVIAGLGGKTGTSLLLPIIELARSKEADVLAVTTLPFSVEDKRRVFADSVLKRLPSSGATFVVHDHAVASREAPDGGLLTALSETKKSCEVMVLKWLG